MTGLTDYADEDGPDSRAKDGWVPDIHDMPIERKWQESAKERRKEGM